MLSASRCIRSQGGPIRTASAARPAGPQLLCAALLAALLVTMSLARNARAELVTGISSVSASVEEVAASGVTSVMPNAWESSTYVRVFREKLDLELTTAVTVDMVPPDDTGSLPPVAPVIPAGTYVTSYLVHFDALAPSGSLSGTIVFDQDILGVMVLAGTISPTDVTFKLVGVPYPTGNPNRGVELAGDNIDYVEVHQRLIHFELTTTTVLDHIRVLTRGDGPGLSFSIDAQSLNYGGAAAGWGIAANMYAADILTVGNPGGPGPNPPVPFPGAPSVMIILPQLGLVPPGPDTRIEIDAFSFGHDAGSRLRFSVDEWASALGGVVPSVRSEGALAAHEAAGDLFAFEAPFASGSCDTVFRGNHRTVDGTGGPGLVGFGLAEPLLPILGVPDGGDNLDEIDLGTTLADINNGWLFFSLDGPLVDSLEAAVAPPNYGSASVFGYSAADILTSQPGGLGVTSIFADHAVLGLDPLDDIDALILSDDGATAGGDNQAPYYSAATDKVYFSLRRGSPTVGQAASNCALPISEGDVLIPPAAAGNTPRIFITAEALGLRTSRSGHTLPFAQDDDLDGMDIMFPKSPPEANQDEVEVGAGFQVDIDVLANDLAPIHPLVPASVRIVEPPKHGFTSYGPMGVISYQHDGSANDDTLRYIVADTTREVSDAARVIIRRPPWLGVEPSGRAAIQFSVVGANPSRNVTEFAFGVAREGRVRLAIHDVNGRLVRSLFDRSIAAGEAQRVQWDGRNDQGRAVGAGVFFARIATPDGERSLRVVRLP